MVSPNLIVGCMIDDQERLEFEEDLISAKGKSGGGGYA